MAPSRMGLRLVFIAKRQVLASKITPESFKLVISELFKIDVNLLVKG
jgi:hypothetical protein